jgi:hypothetical protein
MAPTLFVHRWNDFTITAFASQSWIRGSLGMRKVSEYREHADDCRKLAGRAASPSHRDMLLNMSATWDSLAEDRIKSVARQERIANLETVARRKFG